MAPAPAPGGGDFRAEGYPPGGGPAADVRGTPAAAGHGGEPLPFEGVRRAGAPGGGKPGTGLPLPAGPPAGGPAEGSRHRGHGAGHGQGRAYGEPGDGGAQALPPESVP
jgi:hypothetical protein